MNIIINLTEEEFTNDDLRIIRECLNINEGEEDLHLQKLCKASFMEYLKMFKEKGLPTRADEVQQERLFFLLLHYYENRVPFENDISGIFQITQSQSRTLLRNTNSRFRTKISLFIRNTIKTVLRNAEPNMDTDNIEMEISSLVIKDEINNLLSQKRARLLQLSKKRGYASIYECPLDTFDFLRVEFEIDVV